MSMDFRTIEILMIVITLLSANVSADESIQITLESDKDEYIIKEPLRFKLTFKNVSEEEQRMLMVGEKIHKIDLLGHIGYKIITPNGKQEYGYHMKSIQINQLVSDHRDYSGFPITPGDSLVLFVYPIALNKVTHSRLEREKLLQRRYLTFHEPGVYKVKAKYRVSEGYFKMIFTPQGGVLESNEITLRFREPDPVEKEILDVIWETSPFAVHDIGDYVETEEASKMSQLIAKYPEHPLLKHLEIRVAISKKHYKVRKYDEAIELFDEFQRKYPDFRFHERQVHLAFAYRGKGDKQKAIEIINSAFEKEPACRYDYDLNRAKAIVLYGKKGWEKKWMEKAQKFGVDYLSKKKYQKEIMEE